MVAERYYTIREIVYGMATGGGSTAAGSSGSYSGKAHELIPEFSGKAVDYKEYRKRLLLYAKKMELANRQTETAFNVLSSLKGRAWDACEDITMEKLESTDGMKELLSRLDSVFKYDAITELPADFEHFFVTMQRQRNESMQEYTANFERQLRRLAAHEVTLPDKVVGWFYLRRAGLTQSQRQMIMSTLTTERLSLESVRKGVNFVIGQDSTPDSGNAWKNNRGKFSKESIYAVETDDTPPYPMAESYYVPSYTQSPLDECSPIREDEILEMDEESPYSHYSHYDSDAIYYEFDESDLYDSPEDAAADYDAIMAHYAEARDKVNQMRMSRGYYPVVAMIPERGSGGKDKGKSKGKSSKGKTKTKQAPRPPGAKSRGKAALGAQRCLRCGKAGHNADSCPAAGKRKADSMDAANINMVQDADEINLWEEDGTESEPDDTAQLDCGAASVVVGTQTLRKYLKVLMMKGFHIYDLPVWRCTKGLRFGNGNLDTTNLCALVPTFFKGMRRDVLMYIMNGATPCLLGRPVLEAFHIAINYSDKTMACGKGARFEKATLGPKGEYIVHLAEDLRVGDHREPEQVFLPVDFDDHVHEQTTMKEIMSSDDNVFALEFKDLSEFTPGLYSNDAQFHHDGISAVTATGNAQNASQEVLNGDIDDSLDKLPTGKLNKLVYETMNFVKAVDRDLSRSRDLNSYDPPRNYKVWEVYAGEGRITKTANRRPNCVGTRFSREDGWDFDMPSHRKAFLRKLTLEKPDAVIWSPTCKLWSNLQELSAADNPVYAANLMNQREQNHDTHLTFVAVGYERQRREGRVGLVEHPWTSRAWKTKAFCQMKGFDVYIDMCQYGLVLPNDDGEVLPVRKPTCLRVTSPVLHAVLARTCPRDHEHTPLEGYAAGWGQRSHLAENFTQQFATQVITAILQELSPAFQENVYAVEELEESYNAEAGDGAEAVAESAVKMNRQLKTEVGARAVDYVKRLHRNLGHCSPEVLVRMLKEVQATQDVLTAAARYVCEMCYARKPPKQVPPASGLTCTAFNDRIQVDSHWIQCVESVVKTREPMPGTPAAKRKEKKKKDKEPLGRQCVLTIVDHATRFCAIRILKSEKAEEFTKGLERAWLKNFGLPKLLRVDEAKGWASKHVREWTSSRGITLEVQPAEAHSWLGVVERKHQVIRRALELYQDGLGRHDQSALKEAAIYVPHAINQLSFHKGFSPQQWVLGKAATYVYGLSGEIFNPGQEALDEQGVFAEVQKRRAEAAKAFIAADSDAKLRRAFTQKFREQKEELVVGQQCWYWRNAGAGILRKARWRGPARVVAIEEVKDTQVLWLCHGTALIRCSPHQVRPLVEEMGTFVPADRKAAMRDLEELKARSTTQYRDEVRRSGVNLDAEYPDEDELDAEYSPGTPPAAYEPEEVADEAMAELPGVVSMVLPMVRDEERERTPRRRASEAPTVEPPESMTADDVGSPKRKTEEANVEAEPTVSKAARTEPATSSEAPAHSVPVPPDDELTDHR